MRALALMAVALLCGCSKPKTQPVVAAALDASGPPVMIAEFASDGKPLGVHNLPAVVLTDEQWRARLPAISFKVTRHKETEFAFTGKYHKNHDAGIYRCIGCGTALFHSATKFESNTGWPSFYDLIAPQNARTEVDNSLGISRDEVVCSRCGAHLGHVFPDGPEPTRLRYCMNSASLQFVPFPKESK